MAVRTVLTTEVPEQATALLTTTVRDLDGVGIPAVNLQWLRATLFEDTKKTVLGGRENQDILGIAPAFVNGGSVNSAGGLTLWLASGDNMVTLATKAKEQHVVLLEWGWVASGGVLANSAAEIEFPLINLKKVPHP